MNNIAYRSYRLPSISELLQSVAEQPQKAEGKKKVGVASLNSQFQKTRAGFNERAIELVVSPSTRSSRLYKFYTELEEKLHKLGSDGFISHVCHSQSSGTTFTVKLSPSNNRVFLEAVNNMTEVKEVMEESKGGSAYPNFSQKFNVLLAQ
jgi:hypothetical protein